MMGVVSCQVMELQWPVELIAVWTEETSPAVEGSCTFEHMKERYVLVCTSDMALSLSKLASIFSLVIVYIEPHHLTWLH